MRSINFKNTNKMSTTLYFKTSNPAGLLQSIKDDIKAGHIKTWECDKDGDFTHTGSANQWKDKAWLRPSISANKDYLQFAIIWPTGKTRDNEVYAVYHGRYIEMVLAHFHKSITNAQALP